MVHEPPGAPEKKSGRIWIGHVPGDKILTQAAAVSFTTGVIPASQVLAEKDFAERKLCLAETEAEIAGFEMRLHHWDQVKHRSEIALTSDPKLALAHEDMAFLKYDEGKDDEAIGEFSQAAQLDGKMRFCRPPLSRTETRNSATACSQMKNRSVEGVFQHPQAVNNSY